MISKKAIDTAVDIAASEVFGCQINEVDPNDKSVQVIAQAIQGAIDHKVQDLINAIAAAIYILPTRSDCQDVYNVLSKALKEELPRSS